MAKYSESNVPNGLKALFTDAREGRIRPPDFCHALAGLGVKGPLAMLYVRDAFGLPLETAKEIVIAAQHGSVDSWAEEIKNAIDEL